jgi:hypothetical protein
LILKGLSLVLQAVKLIPKEPRDRTKEDEDALAALSNAYHRTLQYYEFLKDHPRDRAEEAGVAYKWEIVGILMQKYDSTLAERLDAKSRYWREGATWSDDVIRKAGIGLESIRREVKLRIKYGDKQGARLCKNS